MRTVTHLSFSQLLYLLLVGGAGLALSPVAAAATALASVLPDIDSGSTLPGRVCPPLTHWLETRFGHRTLTHSALAIGGLAVLLLPLAVLRGDLYLCLLLGYTSHPVLDSMTVTGVQLFYPFSRLRCVFPMDVKHPHRYRVRTGGKADSALAVGFVLACIPALFVAQAGHGRLIRTVQADIESAVREFRSLEHSCTVYATLEATHVLTGEALAGTFEVLGAPDAHALLVLDSAGQSLSVGAREKAEYIVRTVVCRQGEPITVRHDALDMTGRLLGDLIADGGERRLFFGDLELEGWQPAAPGPRWFSPLRQNGATLRLDHARAADLLPRAGARVRAGTVRTVLRQTGERRDTTAPRRPLLALELRGSSFHLSCSEGDTVGQDALLATSAAYEEIGQELSLLAERLQVMEGEHAADLADLSRRFSSARRRQQEDSIELQNIRALIEEGFAGSSALASARKQLQEAGALVFRLTSEIDKRRSGHALRIAELQGKITGLQKRREDAVLRAPVRARVRSIRRDQKVLVMLLESL